MDMPPKTPAPKPITNSSAHRPRFDSKDLLHDGSAVEIDHAGQLYLLRVTRENKLILTK
jgi:hemin uptake protein HemP